MERFFNIAGPMIPEINYCIDPLSRIDWDEIRMLIGNMRYFVIHAPRQTGKTSALFAMMRALNESGEYDCAYANVEEAQVARGEVEKGIPIICEAVSSDLAMRLNRPELLQWYMDIGKRFEPQRQLNQLLKYWSSSSKKSVVLFIDEVDSLVGDTLISLLRQIRAGYPYRPGDFPQSIVLCGVRDVRDYRMRREDDEIITGGSAFNIKTKSLRMENFTYNEVEELWKQHTLETGQEFDESIFPVLWEDTYGQPWLVNALGNQITVESVPNRDRRRKITLSDYKEAREVLIQSRATHLDQLADKLKEPRVFNVINKILLSDESSIHASSDDIEYVADLGLIRTRPYIQISNRIYQEIIPRELTWTTQVTIANQNQKWYVTTEHLLDMQKLIAAFQQFYREHSDVWKEGFSYKEAAPQLLLQAFLQRIVNGGGIITREYGLGRKRTDLYIEWPLDDTLGARGPLQRIVIEIKLRKGAFVKLLADGLEQVSEYAEIVGADEAHLLIFDNSLEKTWDEKIWHRDERIRNRLITIWGV